MLRTVLHYAKGCALLANAADNLCSLSALDGTSVVSEEQRTAKIKHIQLTFAK